MDYVIIVAGGKGMRMGAEIPKQFLPLNGKPVLMHTLERFYRYNADLNLIVVLPAAQQSYWQELCAAHHFGIAHRVVDGGETRFHSSLNGLAAIDDNETGIVAIHDGVRPLVSTAVIERCFAAARTFGSAIPVMPVVDTLRMKAADGSERNVDRSRYCIVQTPQTFDIALAKRAFQQPYNEAFTDDASVVEQLGAKVQTVEGNRENVKLTTPFDLRIAESLCENGASDASFA